VSPPEIAWNSTAAPKVDQRYTVMGRQERAMARCDVCGNDYDKTFRITQGSRTMTFDSFECAIHAMAPHCAHCDCRVVGHGIEAGNKIYCCAHCAKHEGVKGVSDRRA
jgi:hypothetical protein